MSDEEQVKEVKKMTKSSKTKTEVIKAVDPSETMQAADDSVRKSKDDENGFQLQVNDLSLGYGKILIQEDLNFSINKGDFVCIIGENGVGKSTLMKTMLGLEKPIGGGIDFGVSKSQIGYLPQQNEIQKDFPASVREVVLSGCLHNLKWYMPFYGVEEKKLAAKAMGTTKITDLADDCYRELSGGQQQRVLLARALIAATEILFLDEPMLNLDQTTTACLYETIAEINKQGITIVMVSHDCETAIKLATHVLHLKEDGYSYQPTGGRK